jgi:phosphate-selective porin OprO/OprP
VVGDGESWRVSPQGYYYFGPLGILGEYVVSTVNVRPTAAGRKYQLENTAWDLQVGYVVTGEKASFTGVIPQEPFSLQNHTWGALQLVARYADLRIDPNAFPLFASPSTSAQEASGWGAGANWYLSRLLRINLDFYDTKFGNRVALPGTQILRQDERALVSRVQVYF